MVMLSCLANNSYTQQGTYPYIYISIYIYIYPYIYISISIYTCMYMCIYTFNTYTHTHIYIYIYILADGQADRRTDRQARLHERISPRLKFLVPVRRLKAGALHSIVGA